MYVCIFFDGSVDVCREIHVSCDSSYCINLVVVVVVGGGIYSRAFVQCLISLS